MTNKTCFDSAIVLLARRDHSELEIKKKLEQKGFEANEVKETILRLIELNYLRPANVIAEQLANELSRKNKGWLFINRYLANKGLPSVPKDPESEREKIKRILNTTSGKQKMTDRKKISRFLLSRGFDDSSIISVLKERREEP